jgi:hypothetical protein
MLLFPRLRNQAEAFNRPHTLGRTKEGKIVRTPGNAALGG